MSDPGLLSDVALYAGATLLRATAVLLGALGLALVLRRAPAAARHAMWTATFAVLLVLPALPAVLPTVPIAVPASVGVLFTDADDGVERSAGLDGAAGARMLPPAPVTTRTTSPDEGGGAGISGWGSGSTGSASGISDAAAGGVAVAPLPPSPAGETSTSDASILDLAPAMLVLAWLLVCVFLLGSLGVGLVRSARCCRRAVALRGEGWLRELARACAAVGFGRPVALRASPEVRTGMAGGFLRPLVLVPESAEEWEEERRRIVLAHEVTHLKRGDPLRKLCGHLVFALYWFHPLAWVACRQAALAREEACDEFVIGLGHRPSTYARHLLDLAEPSALPMPAFARATNHSHLEKRIMHLLRSPTTPRTRIVAVAGAAGLAWALGVAAMGPAHGPPSAQMAADTIEPPPPPARTAPPVPTQTAPPLPTQTAPPPPPVSSATAEVPPPAPVRETPRAPDEAAPVAGEPPRAPVEIPSAPGELPLAPIEVPPATTPLASGAPVPPAPRLQCPAPGETTGAAGGTVRAGPGEWMIQQTLEGIQLCLRARGDITLEGGMPDLSDLGPDGWLVLNAEGDGVRQRLEITPGPDGLEHAWFVDGEASPVDDTVLEWRDAMFEVLGAEAQVASVRGDEARLRGEIARERGAEAALRGEIARARAEEAAVRGEVGGVRGEEARFRGELARIEAQEAQLRGELQLREQLAPVRAGGAEARRGLAQAGERIAALERERRLTENPETRARLEAEIEVARARLEAAQVPERGPRTEARIAEARERLEAHEEDVEARRADIEARIERLQSQERAEMDERLRARRAEIAERVAEVRSELDARSDEETVRAVRERMHQLDASERVREIRARSEGAAARLLELIERMR